MRIKALISFSGMVAMYPGEVRNVRDEIAQDLIRAGHAEEVPPLGGAGLGDAQPENTTTAAPPSEPPAGLAAIDSESKEPGDPEAGAKEPGDQAAAKELGSSEAVVKKAAGAETGIPPTSPAQQGGKGKKAASG
jgi:hypothetical protein